jgi:hypothetical protein
VLGVSVLSSDSHSTGDGEARRTVSLRAVIVCIAIGAFIGALVIVAAFVSTLVAFPVVDLLPQQEGAVFAAVDYFLNMGVPAIAGALVAMVATPMQRREFPRMAPMFRHLLWCAGWYAMLIACSAVLWKGWAEPDFWLFGQIFVWPAAALAAAVATDALLNWRRRCV